MKAENLEKCFSLNFWKNVKHQNHYADGDLTIWISLKINTFVAELADLIRVSTKKILMKKIEFLKCFKDYLGKRQLHTVIVLNYELVLCANLHKCNSIEKNWLK